MKKILALLVLLTGFNKSYAQGQDYVDSLLLRIENTQDDSLKIDWYNQLAYYGDADSSLVFPNARKAIELSQKISFHQGEVAALGNLGWTYMRIGLYQEGLKHWNQALDLAKEKNFTKGQAQALNGIGIIYESQGLYYRAINAYIESLKALEASSGDKANHSPVLSNIGVIYMNQGDFPKALQYFNKALVIDHEYGNAQGEAQVLNNMANTYSLQKKYHMALDHYQEALILKDSLGEPIDIASTRDNMGLVYYYLEDYEKATAHCLQALDVYKQYQLRDKYAFPLTHLGMIKNAQGKYLEAKAILQEALSYSEAIGQAMIYSAATEALANSFNGLGEHQMAFEAYKKYRSIKDSLENNHLIKETTQLEANYRFEKEKDSIRMANVTEKLMLEKEISNGAERQKLSYVALALSAALIIILIWFFRSKSKINQRLKQQQEDLQAIKETLELKNLELEDLNRLKNRIFSIIAHDLKSPIQSLQGLMMLYKIDDELKGDELRSIMNRLSDNVDGISVLLDNLLQWSKLQMEGSFSLNPESLKPGPYLNETCDLLAETALRKEIETRCPDSEEDFPEICIDPDLLRFVFRNLLVNAYKYSQQGGLVVVSHETIDNSYLKISVQDFGLGMDKETRESLFKGFVSSKEGTNSESGTGLGLMLCHQFISDSNGEMGVDSILGAGSTFWFTAPLSNSNSAG